LLEAVIGLENEVGRTICVSVQYDVVVPLNEPFSNSLLAGAPPPHTEKYSQVPSQARTPVWMSRWSARQGRLG